jgi:hypothetical protein
LLQRIALEPPLFLRCKFEDPFSNVNRALIHGCQLRTPPRVTVQRPGIPLPLSHAKAARPIRCDVNH